jgi:hypothetical protein
MASMLSDDTKPTGCDTSLTSQLEHTTPPKWLETLD